MSNVSPLSIPSRRTPVATKVSAIDLTLERAFMLARSIDVDDYFYSPIVREHAKSLPDERMMYALNQGTIGSDIRLDFIVGDLCRFTKVGNRF